jgi:1,4-alpha-glucan branching enzyme
MKKILLVVISFTLLAPLFAEFEEYLSEQEKYNRLVEGEAFWINTPLVLDDYIFFYFDGEADKVLLSGDFNGWKRDTPMAYNPETGVWSYRFEDRLDAGDYSYKLVIDDIWTPDPNNTNSYINDYGQEVSSFSLEDDYIPGKTYPLILNSNTYRFLYEGDGLNNVALAGNFNNWNPYAHPMENLGAGDWALDIELKQGFTIYCFVVDGNWIPDPKNLNQYSDGLGNTVNVLYVE